MLVSLFDAGKDTFVVIIILVAILMDFLPHILLKMTNHDDGLENTRDDPIETDTDEFVTCRFYTPPIISWSPS